MEYTGPKTVDANIVAHGRHLISAIKNSKRGGNVKDRLAKYRNSQLERISFAEIEARSLRKIVEIIDKELDK